MKNQLSTLSKVTLALGIIGLLGCNDPGKLEKFTSGTTEVNIQPANQGTNSGGSGDDAGPIPDPDNTICDPLSGGTGGGAASAQSGLLAHLYYLGANDPHYVSAVDYIQKATKADVNIFLNQVYVPTRKFDEGFVTQSGTTLKTPAGDTLYEYFGLQMNSKIKLGKDDLPGLYQFAVLSDDGTVFRLKPGASVDTSTPWSDVINNDFVHPSMFSCANQFVEFTPESRVPMQLDYFQGPKFHISLIVLWRKVTDAMLVSQNPYYYEACGVNGNSLFFDPEAPTITPTWAWDYILNSGWKVLNSSNYELPDNSPSNGCPDDPAGEGDGSDDDDPIVIGV